MCFFFSYLHFSVDISLCVDKLPTLSVRGCNAAFIFANSRNKNNNNNNIWI